jgi:hypothetical protein
MKVTLKRTDDQVALIKAMASKNRDVAYEAQQALADFIGPVIAEVIDNAPGISNLFEGFSFEADDNPSIPLDLYTDIVDEDYIRVYSNSAPGGLASSTVAPIQQEQKIMTGRLDSAVDFDKKFAARSRLDVVSKTFGRIGQEILLKAERTSAGLILDVIQQNYADHVLEVNNTGSTKNLVTLDDFNKLLTKAKRLNTSWAGGTPENRGRGVTDLIVSPEIVESLRAMAYNPMVIGTNTDIPATDDMRNSIYNNAGIPEFFGLGIMELYELGIGQRFNAVFEELDTGNNFDVAKQDLIIALDKSRSSLIRGTQLDGDTGSDLSLIADDQYSARQSRIGFYGSKEEGRMVLNDKVLLAMNVQMIA